MASPEKQTQEKKEDSAEKKRGFSVLGALVLLAAGVALLFGHHSLRGPNHVRK